jgi:hypothetical protein
MTYRLRLPGALYRRAQARADAEDTTLDALILEMLTCYADGQDSPAAQFAAMGGRAAAASLTAQERRERARGAAAARWRDHPRT